MLLGSWRHGLAIERDEHSCLRCFPESWFVYFSAIVRHQIRHLGIAPSREIMRCMQDTKRAVLRGAGTSKLKDRYHMFRSWLGCCNPSRAKQVANPVHMADAMMLCAWWMLREISVVHKSGTTR